MDGLLVPELLFKNSNGFNLDREKTSVGKATSKN